MSEETWKTTFEIKHRREERTCDNGRTVVLLYDVVNKHNGQVVGTYKDVHYAKKQVKRKYKKLVKLVEKHFTSKA